MPKICVYYATGGYYCYEAGKCPNSEAEEIAILNREGAEYLTCEEE